MQTDWNLKDIYHSPYDECLESDVEETEHLISDFAQYKESLEISNLGQAILDYEQIVRLVERISSYAFLYLQTRLDDTEALAFYQKKVEWFCDVNSKTTFFHSAISRLDFEEVQKSFEKDEILKKYQSWILNCFRYKDHLLSDEAEEVLAKKFVTSNNAWLRIYDEILGCMKFEFEKKQQTLTEVLETANHAKEHERRESASRVASENLQNASFYIKHIYNNIILDNSIESKLRRYEKPESFRHLGNNVDQQCIDFLTDSVVEGYGQTTHKYYAIKAKILGKENFEYWDRNVSVKLSSIFNQEFDYKSGTKIVLETFDEFSPVFRDIASDFINKSWIDVYPKQSKTSGGFARSCSVDVHPYILLNFFNTIRDVSTLAHELGHGIHQSLSARNGALLAETPINLSEVASLFSEKLLFEKLFESAKSREEKIDLLCWKLDDTMNSIMRQIAFFKFERLVHDQRAEKELSVEDFSKAFLQTQRECLGPSVRVDDCIGIYWTYISHFFQSPFYVYAYAFADIFVNALYKKYKKIGEEFKDKYILMLSKGGIDRYDIAAKSFGLFPSEKEFWKDGVSAIAKQVEDLEILYNASICG